MRKERTWFDAPFIQLTAFFLNSDIVIVADSATFKFCADLNNESFDPNQ